MKVYLLKDVESVGMRGTVVNVSDGYAANFLFPKKFAVAVPDNDEAFKKLMHSAEVKKEVIASKTSMLAEHIKALKITMRRKTHDKVKLYGSISTSEIADALADHGVKIAKNQIITDKSIKEVGTYEVTVKLTSKLQPKFQLKIISE